jgi:hypothetical protein
MKRTLIALALAVPFAVPVANAASPLASFNDNAPITNYVAPVQATVGTAARVLPSFIDTIEVRADAVDSGNIVTVGTDFHYPAY